MYGPRDRGHWTRSRLDQSHLFLKAGQRYRVLRAFTDYDGDVHPPGEEWTFLGTSFLPYDDGLSLFVSLDGRQEWQIRMQMRPEAQGEVLDRLGSFIGPA